MMSDNNREMADRWDAYLAARDKAEASRNIGDGIEAGLAWRAFMDLFLDAPL